jgi:hypothetical protein
MQFVLANPSLDGESITECTSSMGFITTERTREQLALPPPPPVADSSIRPEWFYIPGIAVIVLGVGVAAALQWRRTSTRTTTNVNFQTSRAYQSVFSAQYNIDLKLPNF